MIVGLIGPHCCGKEEIANYLKEKYEFKVVDIRKIFEYYKTQIEGIEGAMKDKIKSLKIDKFY